MTGKQFILGIYLISLWLTIGLLYYTVYTHGTTIRDYEIAINRLSEETLVLRRTLEGYGFLEPKTPPHEGDILIFDEITGEWTSRKPYPKHL